MRQDAQLQFEEEERKIKENQLAKKLEFKQIQETDHANKMKFKQQKDQSIHGVKDFGDHNVFSYIYSTKIHKSHAMAEKKDHMIDMMKDKFITRHDQSQVDKDVMNLMKDRNNKAEQELQDRISLRKNKEMEAKLFQDN